MDSVSISCDECRLEGTEACEDCVVTFLCELDESRTERHLVVVAGQRGADPVAPRVEAKASTGGGGMVIDAAEARAMRMLEGAGLIPRLRFERRTG